MINTVGTAKLYLSVRPVFREEDLSLSELKARVIQKLPVCEENSAYLARLTPQGGISSVMYQRLTALCCFLDLLDKVLPRALPFLRLCRDERGRPYAKCTDTSVPFFDFNLSHSAYCVACAILVGEGHVGIDIEPLISSDRAPKIAARFFSKKERTYLNTICDPERYATAATSLWTAKEALSKQDGRGSPQLFDSFAVHPDITLLQGQISADESVPCVHQLTIAVPTGITLLPEAAFGLPVSFA